MWAPRQVPELELLDPRRRRTRSRPASRPTRAEAAEATPRPVNTHRRAARPDRRRVRHRDQCSHRIQVPTRDVGRLVLHRRERATCPGPRRHATLHALADRPVLAVDEIPEVTRVGRVERCSGDLVRVEQQVAHDPRARRTPRLQVIRRDMFGRHAQQQVGIDLACASRSAASRPANGARCDVAVDVNAHAPSRSGCRRPSEPRATARNAGHEVTQLGCTGAQW